MKYSMICLDRAIEIALPTCSKWPKTIGRTTLLDMAAKQFFMYPEKFMGHNEMFAAFVVREALVELSTVGWITFGDVDEFWG